MEGSGEAEAGPEEEEGEAVAGPEEEEGLEDAVVPPVGDARWGVAAGVVGGAVVVGAAGVGVVGVAGAGVVPAAVMQFHQKLLMKRPQHMHAATQVAFCKQS